MTNLGMGLFILMFVIVGLPVTILSILKRKESEVSVWFTLLCAANITWAVLHALEYLLADEATAAFVHNCKLAAVGAAALFTYLVVLGALRRKKIGGKLIAYMMVVPLCTLLVSVADAFLGTQLLYSEFSFQLQDGVRVLTTQGGVWFWLHCMFCYTFLCLAMFIMVRHFLRMPKRYKTSSSVLLIGIFLSTSMTVLAILEVLPHHFDAGDPAAILAQIFYYFAIFHPQSVDLLMSSREVIFEKADYPMLVLNNEREIVDYNGYAALIGHRAGLDRLKGTGYDEFFNKWVSSTSAQISEDSPSIFTIHEDAGDIHFQVITHDIYSATQKKLGIHMEIKNITPTMTLVHKLEAAAYFDNLTGLRNRNYFIQVGKDFDDRAHFPLGVMVGDLNNLKSVNDHMGHMQGDRLLQRMAGVLMICKPENAAVFRMGGDEFIALVPKTSAETMEKLINDIRARCAWVEKEEGLPLSIALGYKLKIDFSQSLQEVVRQADIEMYRDKHDRRS